MDKTLSYQKLEGWINNFDEYQIFIKTKLTSFIRKYWKSIKIENIILVIPYAFYSAKQILFWGTLWYYMTNYQLRSKVIWSRCWYSSRQMPSNTIHCQISSTDGYLLLTGYRYHRWIPSIILYVSCSLITLKKNISICMQTLCSSKVLNFKAMCPKCTSIY